MTTEAKAEVPRHRGGKVTLETGMVITLSIKGGKTIVGRIRHITDDALHVWDAHGDDEDLVAIPLKHVKRTLTKPRMRVFRSGDLVQMRGVSPSAWRGVVLGPRPGNEYLLDTTRGSEVVHEEDLRMA